MGLPGPSFYNVDPQTRLSRTTGGCLVSGSEFLFQAPNNCTLAVLTKVFGPMRGSYDGPYPTEEQANAALGGATALNMEQFKQGRIAFDATSIEIGQELATKLLWQAGLTLFGNDDVALEEGKNPPAIDAAVINTVVILRLRRPFDSEHAALIVLIDSKTTKPFAFYYRGQHFPRRPATSWSDY